MYILVCSKLDCNDVLHVYIYIIKMRLFNVFRRDRGQWSPILSLMPPQMPLSWTKLSRQKVRSIHVENCVKCTTYVLFIYICISSVVCNLPYSIISGVDEATIIDTLAQRSNAQRQQIKAAYQQATGKVGVTLAHIHRTRNTSIFILALFIPIVFTLCSLWMWLWKLPLKVSWKKWFLVCWCLLLSMMLLYWKVPWR